MISKEERRRICIENAKKHNEYEMYDSYVKVKMTNCDEYMLCDVDDWEKAKQHSWFKTKAGYVRGHAETKTNIAFHNFILCVPDGYVVDHINHDRMDNRKSNLRFLTVRANTLNNKLSSRNKSGYKGVIQTKSGKWLAYIFFNRKSKTLGTYEKIEDAIRVRKIAEEELFNPILDNESLQVTVI